MSLIAFSKNPSERELKQFRLGLSLFAVVIGAMALRRGASVASASVPFAALLAVALASQFVASWRRPIYLIWMRAAVLISTPLSFAIMAFTYFCVLTPIALVVRACRLSPVARRFDRQAKTYWRPRPTNVELRSYFRQF